MIVNKGITATALALSLAFLGTTSAAYAWVGEYGHDKPSAHQVGEHNNAGISSTQQSTVAFADHGGGHEKAGNNAATHAAELSTTSQSASQVYAFDEHGGGHEKAADNPAIHAKEKNHRD
ncbi:MAG: hypothetical protein QM579_04225 [Desulfovibrio sp.]|uniref:hypothetical protein n=1 Tax=Desulfovibrio sp. TaxID=885 RepID=UPI0039E2E66F